MNLAKVNVIAYRFTCIVICLFLVIGGLGMLDNHYPVKATIGFVTAIIIGFLAFRKPSPVLWGSVVFILLFAMFFVGLINK
jgi:hypothetical protein